MFRRNSRPRRADYFVAQTARIEAGATVDDDGHPAERIVRLVFEGTWSNGRSQRIPVLVPAEHVATLAAALGRMAAAPNSETRTR